MRSLLLLPALLLFLAQTARATWSIVVCDVATGEVLVASATCLPNLDLKAALPVVRVGVGGAAAQSALDSGAANRQKIWNQLGQGTPPAEILQILAAGDFFHSTRQYGIVDFDNPPVKFTGGGAGQAKKAVTGTLGTLRYAIQGNVLTSQTVITEAEKALRFSSGDLGQRVLAAMEAARALGGDGRCSCSPAAPTSCGAPPAGGFSKSAHIAFFVIARHGDVDGVCNGQVGCANGSYYLDLNVIGSVSDPDPVLTLTAQYAAWRAALAGKPDHILSTVVADAERLPADGQTTTTVTVALADVDGVPVGSGGAAFGFAGSGLVTVGAITDNGNGMYSFPVTAGLGVGTEELVVTVDAGSGPVELYPPLTLELDPPAALHASQLAFDASAPVDVDFTLDLGPAAAGQPYVLLASFSGTAPGTPLGDPLATIVPLNQDALTNYMLANPGPPLFPGSLGFLDPAGRATAGLTAPAASFIPFIGQSSDWAALTLFQPHLVSNPVRVDIE